MGTATNNTAPVSDADTATVGDTVAAAAGTAAAAGVHRISCASKTHNPQGEVVEVSAALAYSSIPRTQALGASHPNSHLGSCPAQSSPHSLVPHKGPAPTRPPKRVVCENR